MALEQLVPKGGFFARTRGLFRLLSGFLPSLASRPRQILLAPGPVDFEPVEVDREGEPAKERISAHQWILDACPSLRGTFTPSWWLGNGHLQTIYSVIGNFEIVDKITYSRTLIRTPDGGTIGLDFVHNPDSLNQPVRGEDTETQAGSEDATPILVIAHGLTGGSYESYVRNVLHYATLSKAKGGLGMRGCVVNFRGCANTPVTSAQLYSAGQTNDYRSAIHYIHSTYPNAPLLGCGFSLGAGVLARFIGEEGAHCVLKAGVVVAAPWDCPGMSRRLDATWFSRNVYSKAMGQNILNIYRRILGSPPPAAALTPSSTRPPSPSDPCADGKDWVHPIDRPDSRLFKHVETLAKMKRPLLREIDECVVREVGGNSPPFPFPSAEAYYEWASPKHRLPGIKIPTLCLNAFDDPIIPGDMLPLDLFKASSHAVLAIVGSGGHLGWFEGGFPGLSAPRRWLHLPVGEFLTAAVNELVISPAERAEKRVVLNEHVGFELLAQNEGGGPFTWVARQRVFADGTVEHFAPTSKAGLKVANGGLQGL